MDPRFVAVSEPRLPAGSAPPRRSKPRPSGWSREPKSALPSEMKPQRSPEVRCPSSSLQRRRCVPHDSDEDRGSKSTERANPRGEPRDRARVAETGQADPKACAARDRFASVNRTQHTPALRNRTASREPPSARATSPDRSVGRSLETRLVWHHDASRCCHRRARAKRRHRRAKRTRSEQAIAETVSVLPSGRPRRPKPLERSTRKRRTGCPSNGAIDSRRPKPPGACRAALGTGARSTPRRIDRPKLTETAQRIADGVPEMVPKVRRLPGRSRRSSCTIRARTGAQTPQVCPPFQPRSRSRLDDSCARTGRPVAEGAPPSPAETRKKTTTTAPRRGARLPKVLHPNRPKPGRDPQRLRPDGVPSCRRCLTRAGRNQHEQGDDCFQTVARVPQPRHSSRPKPRRDRRQQRSDGCPKVAGASLSAAETAKRSASTTLGRVPEGRRRVTFRSRNHGEIGVDNARTGARLPKVRRINAAETAKRRRNIRARTGARLPTRHHPLQPKPKRAAPHRRPDGCPFADETSPPPAETGESSATSTPGRVPVCRRSVTPRGRNRKELRTIHDPTRCPSADPRHLLQPKPEKTPRHRRQDECPFADETSPPPAEAEESSATSTPGRVPVCRRPVTTSGRNQRELRTIRVRAGALDRRHVTPFSRSQRAIGDIDAGRCPFAAARSATRSRSHGRPHTRQPPDGARLPLRAPPPAAEATDDLTRQLPDECPFAAPRSATRSRSHGRPHTRRLPDGCPITVTRSAPTSRNRRRHLTPRISDGCPVTVTRSAPTSRNRRRHLTPRIPDGCPAAVRSTPSSRNRKATRAHRLSDGCPVAATRSALRGPLRPPNTSRTSTSGRGGPVAVRSPSAGRNRKTTRAHRLSDGCPFAATRYAPPQPLSRRGVGAPRRPDGCPVTVRWPTLAETRGDVAHIDSRTVPGRSTLGRLWPKPEATSRTSTLGRVPGCAATRSTRSHR
jgi:hypothetical protein